MAGGGLAGEDDVFAGVAINEAGLFPGCGEVAEEVEFELGEFVEVVGLYGYALDGGLHDDAGGHFEDIGGLTGMTALVVA